jgi:hypothetical protein
MNYRLADRIIAAGVFLYALVLFCMTVAPTVSFWDPGERIAVSHGLQIPHPPGAPFYMLVGRIFSMFMPIDYVALSVNMISVLSSALTVLLTYLIVIQLVREWKGPRENWTSTDHIMAYAGGIIGGLTLAVSDSFWFDAVEAETYAFSTFFTAMCVWLTLQWSNRARLQDAQLAAGTHHAFGSTAERWLIVIAYLYGLSIGVHLLSLLSIFFVALIVYFQHFESPEWDRKKRFQGLVLAGAISSAVFLLIYPGVIQYLPEFARRSGAPVMFLTVLAALVIFGLYYTQKNGMRIANMAMLIVTVVLIGYSTYAIIFIRSAADPPIDQNDPETVEDFISYLKREQYGTRPLFRGATYDPAIGRVNFDRDVFFPRMHSGEPHHIAVYQRYNSDLDFFLRYQIGHMYVRYFLWNFVGRAGDVQDSPAITGFRFIDAQIEQAPPLQRTPSEQASRNRYFALPLILGLIGAGFHMSRDWRRAFAVGILFVMTGIGIILYLNQTPMQPRERDYSYVGSFFAFSLWVGLGATGLIQLLSDALRPRLSSLKQVNGAAIGLGVLLFAAVPLWMLAENYDDHDRSSNYVPREYALNMLESVEHNAILFTNGDNDTFPLWYLQEVEGIRRDVRVVNLSLLNTPWYVRQMKNQWARDSAPLPISLTDQQIDNLTVVRWDPAEVTVPADPATLSGDRGLLPSQDDAGRVASPMRWTLRGRPFGQDFNILYAADQVVFDMVRTNARQGWTRPIYFAVTVSPDGQIGLDNFLQMEGQAFRVTPIQHDTPLGRVVPGLSDERLFNMQFTGLDDPTIYFDENIRRMTDNYRNVFAHTAQQLAEMGETERAQRVLDLVMERVPFETIAGDERSYLLLARAYDAIGDSEMVSHLMTEAEPVALHRLRTAQTNRQLDLAAQYVQMIRLTYLEAGDFDAAAAFSGRIADVLDDPAYRQSPEELRDLYERQRRAMQVPPAPPGS